MSHPDQEPLRPAFARGRAQARQFAFAALLLWLPAITTAPRATTAEVRTFHGLCDASAVVDAGGGTFWVANDEENTLRLYDPNAGSLPVGLLPLDGFLKVDPEEPEADIEGAATDGDLVFWITSHGRNKDGKKRESRHRMFATRLLPGDAHRGLSPLGEPYRDLLRDLTADARYAGFQLKAAAKLAPKDEGGLNIEGLAPGQDGALWIGFRNPIPAGRALLVPLLNPRDLLLSARRAKFGEPRLLDLNGLGVRDLARSGDAWLILAGRPDQGGGFRLFRWDGRTERPAELALQLPGDFNPEAILPGSAPDSSAPHLLFLSDDGTREVNDCKCKDLTDPTERRFRALWLPLPAK